MNKKGAKKVAEHATRGEVSRARRRVGLGALVGIVGVIGVASWLGWQQGWFGPSVPPLPLPANLERIEPDVARLIRAKHQEIEQTPRDGLAYADLGLVFEANQLWNDAREAYARATLLRPDDVRWRFHWAMAFQETGDFPAALRELRTVVAASPDLAPAQQRLGYALLETGEMDAARQAFERVIQAYPQAVEGHVGLAAWHLRQGDPGQAAKVAEHALSLDSDYTVAHFLLGTALNQLGRTAEGANHLALGVDANIRYLPDSLAPKLTEYAVNAKSLVSVGGRQLAQGRVDQAIRTLERVLRVEPDNVSALNNLAVAFVQKQRHDEAYRLLQRAAEIDPTKYLTSVNLANWANASGKSEQALQYAAEAIQKSPQIDIPHRTYAVLLAQAGRAEEALASAQKAAEINPRDARTHILCGDLAMKLRRPVDGAAAFRQAAKLAPQRINAWLGLARASWVQGQTTEALAALEQARRLEPGHAQVRELTSRWRSTTP